MALPKPGQAAPLHALAELFPPMNADEYQGLLQDIKKNGQRADIVLLDGKVLDGANRQKACLELKITPKYREYDYIKDGKEPVAFVSSVNLQRRSLTASQRAVIGAEILSRLQKAGAEPKPDPKAATPAPDAKAPGGANTPAAGATPGTIVAGAAKPAKKEKEGKLSQKAAKLSGASPRSVERAAKIVKANPKAAADVKAGKTTLGAAEKALSKADRLKRDFEDAVGRISQVCGKSLGDAVKEGLRLKGKGEAVEFAQLDEKKMLAIRGLIDNGWKLKEALKYKLVSIARTHKIGDLLTRAQAQGSSFELEIEGWQISLKKLPEKKK